MSKAISIWSILKEIAEKDCWYDKIFDDSIISKWKTEANNDPKLELAIKILRTSTQGMVYDKSCDWDEGERLCEECKTNFLNSIGGDGEGHDRDDMWDLYDEYDVTRCPHKMCYCVKPDNQLINFIDYGESILAPEFRNVLVNKVKEMRAKSIDWHPWTNEMVLNIIHPSLYCLVNEGVSDDVPEEKYQWLPSEIYVGENGETTFQSYINNLKEEDSDVTPLLETVISSFIPSFEKVLKVNLKNRVCQVIIKIASTILTEEKSQVGTGSWHIEGVPMERIVATGIYYLEVENISSSYLEFRKPAVFDELNLIYPQGDGDYVEHHYGLDDMDGEMNQYLGLIKAISGHTVCFPNTLQHRIKNFSLDDKEKGGTRTAIVVFLIDPENRITSTKDIPKQQGLITLADAEKNREELMKIRKYFVNHMNKKVYEREFSLCEH
jgi:hypothetical protein